MGDEMPVDGNSCRQLASRAIEAAIAELA